ncbi:MAG: hypothetical protein OXI24_15935, partial [Candidatus Poribacteria bacterium]|nr:hypothetical protein [Candidatus Poribacteria bacterium]
SLSPFVRLNKGIAKDLVKMPLKTTSTAKRDISHSYHFAILALPILLAILVPIEETLSLGVFAKYHLRTFFALGNFFIPRPADFA